MRRLLILVTLLAGAWAPPALAQRPDLIVFAAASLKNALDALNAIYTREGGPGVKVSYAASSALAKQIESGAPADIFMSADLEWMDYVAQRKLIRPETRAELLGNAIVLIAPTDSRVSLNPAPGFALADALGATGRLAMGEPNSVPAGKYGKAALEKLGVWASVQPRVASAENVRAALVLVARGEAPLGIVYRTDAAVEPTVKIVGTFPADSHPPIIYPVAVTATSTNPQAAAYLAWLKSPAARPAFAKQGFAVLD